ncbi:hypothetical protein [Rhodococcus sp. X156]|uniref:hypothetical protein n=1 Tax=Rhodococcus sp. X156 TaxID=2499145 RepID=UPI000FD75898|nr:hypothetical protein [Rhodococcus sp. X156]
MAVDRTRPRPDLAFLRRRPHPGQAAQPAAQAPARPDVGSLSLSHGPPAPAAQLGRPAAAEPPVRLAERVRGRTVLTPDAAMVVLDRRQSAIGSLAVDLVPQGRLCAVWELVDGTSGVVSEASGVRVSLEHGRRPLVELRRGTVLVGLRHVHQLRRLLLVVDGLDPAAATTTTVLSLYDESTVESVHETHVPTVATLAMYQVGGELVVRREGFGFPDVAAAAKAYGFAATWVPPLAPRAG